MNKKRKIIIYSIAIIVLILYLTFSYHGILFFTKAYNGLDYVIFNVLGDAILVGITTFISTKYISVYISKKEFDRNNQININIQEKRHTLYTCENFLGIYSDSNLYFGMKQKDIDVIEYVYKKYNAFSIVLNKANINDKMVENILNYPFIYSFITKGKFIDNWKKMINTFNIKESKKNVELLKALIKDEDYDYFERFSEIVNRIRYYEIVNINSIQSCVLLVTANNRVIDKISCNPNEKYGLYLYFDEDIQIQFIGFNHNYEGKEEYKNLMGFKYTNNKEKTMPADIELEKYIKVNN